VSRARLEVRNFLLGAVTGILVFLCAGLLYLRLGFFEVRGDLPPSSFENSFMTAAVHASVRRHAPAAPNPIMPTDENLIAGGKLFQGNCSGCHGDPNHLGENGDSLFPPVPQLYKFGTQYTESQIFWVAKHGIRRTGMFANGKWSSDKDLWTMAAYISRIKNLPPVVQRTLAAEKH
jgi:mono/diheme cytochrome c family protein